MEVPGTGSDSFFRNAYNLEENVFVNVSSVSSSDYATVRDVGAPEQAARDVIDRYLQEFMSTRIGIKRESEVVYADEREADDGRLYYDLGVRIKSFATLNQYGLTQEERPQRLEWDRTQLVTYGVENKRLYECRVQVPTSLYERDTPATQRILRSFRVFPMEEGKTAL